MDWENFAVKIINNFAVETNSENLRRDKITVTVCEKMVTICEIMVVERSKKERRKKKEKWHFCYCTLAFSCLLHGFWPLI